MGLFSKEKYVLWNIEEKEIVWEGKALLSKESVQQDIEDENLEDTLYRMEIWSGGRKVRNAWVMRKARKKLSAEEIAAKGREEAEAYIQQKAIDIKKDVEDYETFVNKIRKMYSIEGGDDLGKIQIPTGKDGNLGIMEAFNLAIAESTYEGVRATKPQEVAATVKSVMDSGTTILAGVAQMLTERMLQSKKPKANKEVEKKIEPEKKKEEQKPAPKKEEVNIHKEDLGDGKSKTTFGSRFDKSSTDPNDKTFDTTLRHKEPVTYEQYQSDMLGTEEEPEVNRRDETEEEYTRRKFEEM